MLKSGEKLPFIVMYWIPTALAEICFHTKVENCRKTFLFSGTYCIHLSPGKVNGILLVKNVKLPSKTQSLMSTAPVILPITAKNFRGLKDNIKTMQIQVKDEVQKLEKKKKKKRPKPVFSQYKLSKLEEAPSLKSLRFSHDPRLCVQYQKDVPFLAFIRRSSLY